MLVGGNPARVLILAIPPGWLGHLNEWGTELDVGDSVNLSLVRSVVLKLAAAETSQGGAYSMTRRKNTSETQDE